MANERTEPAGSRTVRRRELTRTVCQTQATAAEFAGDGTVGLNEALGAWVLFVFGNPVPVSRIVKRTNF